MDFDQILNDLKNNPYKPIYFFMGEETYFIDQLTEYIANNVLNDAEKSFDQLILYGQDVDAADVIVTARRFPMVAKYQVIIVKEAQNIRNIEDLVTYCEKPLKTTILVINYKYKTLDKRKKLYTTLQNNAVLFNAEKLYEDKIPGWISNHLQPFAFSIKPDAALLLTNSLGNDLGKLVNDLNKLMIILTKKQSVITSELIEQH